MKPRREGRSKKVVDSEVGDGPLLALLEERFDPASCLIAEAFSLFRSWF